MKKPVKIAVIIAVCLAAALAGLFYYMSPENLDVVLPALGHGLGLLRGTDDN